MKIRRKNIAKLLEKHYGKEREKDDALDFFKKVFQNVLEGRQVVEEENYCEEEQFDFGT